MKPGLPHNMLFGHIPTLAKESPKLPTDAHSHVLMNELADKYNFREDGLFYMDVYPIQNFPMLVVASPEVAVQIAQISNPYPKHPKLKDDYGAVFGYEGLVVKEGAEWKELRSMFNPGFSQANLLTMVAMIAEETEVFASRLSNIASRDGFVSSIETLAAELTVDIIGQAVFGQKFNSQTSTNTIVNGIIQASRIVGTDSDISPQRLNLWKYLKLKYYETTSNNQLLRMLRLRWSELASSPEKAAHSNSIFDIAMATYMKKGGKVDVNVTKEFLELMRDKYEILPAASMSFN